MDEGVRLDRALQQLDRLAAFYPRVEGKASFLLGLNVGLVSLMAINIGGSDEARAPFLWIPVSLTIALSGFSCVILFAVFFPHLKGAKQKSYTYFRDISSRECTTFVESWITLTETDLLRDTLIQIWRNSQILRTKFDATERAFKVTLLALIPWAVAMFAIVSRAGKVIV
jgi:hypothetical protein